MAKKFEFRKVAAELDIAGHRFDLAVNAESAGKIEAWGKDAQVVSKQLEAGEKTIDNAWDFLLDSIDALLGDGASDTIFAEYPEADYLDALEVMTYIVEEFNEARANRTPAAPAAPLNREQRRSSARKG